MNTVHIYQFHVEKAYQNITVYLGLGFLAMSLLTLGGIMTFWESSGMLVIILYIIGVAIIVFMIIVVELNNLLEIKNITLRLEGKHDSPSNAFSFWFLKTYSVICPFCRKYMEINHSNKAGVLKFSAQHSICMHYRGLHTYGREARYAKFVNPRKMDKYYNCVY